MVIDFRAQFLIGFHLNDLWSRHSNTEVIGITRILWDDDLVARLDVRHRLRALRIRPADAGYGRKSDSRFAASCNDGAWRTHVRGDFASDCWHQFVKMDVILRRLVHSLLYLWQRLRAGDDGVGAARVEDRPDAYARVEIVRGGSGANKGGTR